MKLYIDIETYCDLDIRDTNVYRYTEHDSFDIMMAAWAVDDDPVEMAIGADAILEIPYLFDPAVLKVAHNAAFERVCFSRWVGMPTGEYLDPREWHDTMAVAGEYGWPLQLAMLGKALGGAQKDSAGTALINFFCKPYRGERRDPRDHPEKWAQFVEYCRQDVVTLRDVDKRLGAFPTKMERAVYMADQRINDRGIRVDQPMVQRAIRAGHENAAEHLAELRQLTGLDNPNSTQQLRSWFAGTGRPLPNVQAKTVEKLLLEPGLAAEHRRALELRQELALVASKKFRAAADSVSDDGRLRGQFRFFGAHTGRWSGKGVQLHNLPRLGFEDADEEATALFDLMELDVGADATTLKKLVRPMFLGPFGVVDYAAIEARVIAWLAGEQWALDAFAAGRDIYVETAERMSTPGNTLTRFQGKVAVLALGYNGGINSLRNMGGEGTDEDLQFLVTQWREANPRIVRFWKQMEASFRRGGPVGKHLRVEKRGNDRMIVLPSKRALHYHSCGSRQVQTPWGMRDQVYFRDWRKNGVRTKTYGGKLSENVTQAVARDLLAEALVRLESNGHRVVAHVHDEIIVETDDATEITKIMTAQPGWAKGLPINGKGFTCERYRKD